MIVYCIHTRAEQVPVIKSPSTLCFRQSITGFHIVTNKARSITKAQFTGKQVNQCQTTRKLCKARINSNRKGKKAPYLARCVLRQDMGVRSPSLLRMCVRKCNSLFVQIR